MINLFKNKLDSLNIIYNDDNLVLLEKLYERLICENEKYNLTSITEKDKVYMLHFLDSLTSIPYIDKDVNLCDIGSGGGFPALPLKIFRPDINLTMLDSVNKKVNYLNSTLSYLGLDNGIAIHSRIEDFAKGKNREYFDVVTSRAVAKLPTLLEYAIPLLRIGGIFIAYKSSFEEELESSNRALLTLGAKLEKVVPVNIDDMTRNLVIFKKVKQTPPAYPRGGNRERTSPIL